MLLSQRKLTGHHKAAYFDNVGVYGEATPRIQGLHILASLCLNRDYDWIGRDRLSAIVFTHTGIRFNKILSFSLTRLHENGHIVYEPIARVVRLRTSREYTDGVERI